MPSSPSDIEAAEKVMSERPDPKEVLRRSFISGLAILLPLVVTLLVISFVISFIANALSPFVGAVQQTPLFGTDSDSLILSLTIVIFLMLVIAIGLVAEYGSESGRMSSQFDAFMESVPGIGSVYTSFNEMSDLLLDSDTDSFQDVKLVEYPGEDSYVVAFKTAETPQVVAEDTGNEDMITLFMPMAPNPVMGGFVIHVSQERVVDVDLTVEQGIRSIVTSGVVFGDESDDLADLDEEQLRQLSNVNTIDDIKGSNLGENRTSDSPTSEDR
ncbi:DUF502 domain-containing protein [Natronomonas halophila]|uniref:DUF502 domain-containing protein n=1 Tax=Natronomonas halophila TaxID=2747817 RepID=UPI0015B46738|nr:DUF502 domain-containing protein [Natronomonas halophila]QLD84378.1 DUF502 domain-containing protein [Natronomonas halophila]